jgi:hypothetical protein
MNQFAVGSRVYDIGLDRYGVIAKPGAQQSEVRFDDGAVRFIPNRHLKLVGAKTRVL